MATPAEEAPQSDREAQLRQKGAAYFERVLNATTEGRAIESVPIPASQRNAAATAGHGGVPAAAVHAPSPAPPTTAPLRQKRDATPVEFAIAERFLGSGGPVLATAVHFVTLATGVVLSRISMHVFPVPGLFLLLQALMLGGLAFAAYSNGLLSGAGAAAAAA